MNASRRPVSYTLPILMLSAFLLRGAAFTLRQRTSSFNRPKSTKRISTSLKSLSHIAGKPFVSIEEGIAAKKDDFIQAVFVDGSWYLGKDRDGRAEYENGPRIEGAKFFDIDDVASTGDELNPKGLPHMAPPKKLFAAAMDKLGICNADDIIIYGGEGCMFVFRAWYTFKAMGHDESKVHLLQGSLKEWEEKGGPMETGPVAALKVEDFDLHRDPSYQANDAVTMCGMEDVLKTVNDGDSADCIILDARPAARFKGEAPEPREGVRGGRMPGAINIPITDLVDSDDKTKLKPVEELRQIFDVAGVDVNTEKRIICTCGSGVTACSIAAALERCGRQSTGTSVYDGSWLEWGSDATTPIV